MGRKKEIHYFNGRLAGSFLTQETCDKLEAIIQASQKGNAGISKIQNKIMELSDADVSNVIEFQDASIATQLEGALSPQQTLSVGFMFYAERCLIGDSVGMGKTVEVAGVYNLLREKYGRDIRFLYLTEKTGVSKARFKLVKFTGEYVEELAEGTKKVIEKYSDKYLDMGVESTVGPHSLLTSPVFQSFVFAYKQLHNAFPYDMIVIDESAVLKNSATNIYKVGKTICDQARWCFLLNATPFEVNLADYYNQLNFIDDTFLPTKTAFSKAYEIMDYSGIYARPSGKYKNAAEFRKQVGYRYFAQTRKKGGATMVNCSAHIVTVPLSSAQRELLKQVSMPQMVFDYPSYFKFAGVTENSPKIDAMVKLVSEELYDQNSILVYTIFKEVQGSIRESFNLAGISCEIMNGDTPIDVRNNLIDGFKNQEYRILVTNVMRGLDFGHCNVCIFYSHAFSPAKMVQFEGRMTRTFNIRDKRSFILCTEGRELNRLKTVVADRAKAMELFADNDFSCVLQLLCNLQEGELSAEV